MASPVVLPVFGPGASFFDVEGEAVSISNGEVRVWRDGKPAPFSLDSALRGGPISEARFREMVSASS